MSLNAAVRAESNGDYASALKEVQTLRQDLETPLELVHALRSYENHLRSLVPTDPLAWFRREPREVRNV